jgi:predicted transcriptional regulator of viral defense system
MSLRPVKQVIQTQPTIEGAGVKLQRAFGFGKTKEFDPFLLLDDFRHGILPSDSGHIWMAIDRKAKKPVVDGLKLRFVRFSGHALTQEVVNTKIDGVPVRIYSAAKTVADCLKYRRKIGNNLAARILQESIAGRKCSEQRLRHFAKICRVYKIVHAAYLSADPSVRASRRQLIAASTPI